MIERAAGKEAAGEAAAAEGRRGEGGGEGGGGVGGRGVRGREHPFLFSRGYGRVSASSGRAIMSVDKAKCRALRAVIQQPETSNAELQRFLDQAAASLNNASDEEIMNHAAELFFDKQNSSGRASSSAAASSAASSAAASAASSGKRPAPPSSGPGKVWLVVHDKEPQDSGSDYRYSSTLPQRQDTEIVSAHATYNGAARAAAAYCLDNELLGACEDATEDERMTISCWGSTGQELACTALSGSGLVPATTTIGCASLRRSCRRDRAAWRTSQQ